ncbi:ATP-binding cassette domain-containing protein [Candidatus Woesearchaeota archaeon]|nr:ATP-binding cassette domain-containing protein [Candidatus Woesearchaeota archaeon]
MIQVKNLWFKYENDFILKNVNLEIKENNFIAIIGANGSGKTTLAKHFNSLLTPTKGNIIIDGLNTKKNEVNARKKVGFVFQNFEDQIIHSIVEEDIAFGLENLGLSDNQASKIVRETLDKLRINHIAKSNVNMLSMGQKQLVALAGVLAMKPKYIVFDEPTTNLDVRNKSNILNVIKDLNKNEEITAILITNVLDDLMYAENAVVMKNGQIIFDDVKSKLNKKILKKAGLNG